MTEKFVTFEYPLKFLTRELLTREFVEFQTYKVVLKSPVTSVKFAEKF